MENITEEIRTFLSSTGLPQCVLAKEAGVSAATISRIWKKKQHEMIESRAKNLRAAMSRLAGADIVHSNEVAPQRVYQEQS